ncbi:hypothetical protein [Streptomyces katrae]|uniref:hypothetical protein n=1 Tax=Streptomyces katrae TaxID=68223 RepID=UPI000A7DF07B|nr:hypothetical protein [Streptomyces katrae]
MCSVTAAAHTECERSACPSRLGDCLAEFSRGLVDRDGHPTVQARDEIIAFLAERLERK